MSKSNKSAREMLEKIYGKKEIWKDIKGKLKTAGGYIWKYLEV